MAGRSSLLWGQSSTWRLVWGGCASRLAADLIAHVAHGANHRASLSSRLRPNFLARQVKRTDQFVVFHHRDHHVRPNAAKFDGGNRPRAASFNVVPVLRKVCDVDGLFVCYRLTYKVFRNKVYPQTSARLDQGRWRIIGRDEVR
jgi:hypothetical protein